MVLSESKKFLFIHIPRTAGTSMQAVLKEFEVTDLASRSRWYQEYLEDKKRLPPHLTFKGAEATLKTDLTHYFCFAFVRNPWERYVSLYIYFRRMTRHVMYDIARSQNFSEFIDDVVRGKTLISQYNNDGRPQMDYISPLRYRHMDFIGRVEELDRDWAVVCKRLEIEAELPKLNMDSHFPYRTYYNEKTRKAVATYCSEEIHKFGYSF